VVFQILGNSEKLDESQRGSQVRNLLFFVKSFSRKGAKAQRYWDFKLNPFGFAPLRLCGKNFLDAAVLGTFLA